MTPTPFRVISNKRELADTFTLELKPAQGSAPFSFAPGQFNMLYAFGMGEVPISISGDSTDSSVLVHTIRSVGTVTETMRGLKPGDTIGLRGPFGAAWPMAQLEGKDVLVITGGIGLAPLRPAIYHLLANRNRFGRIAILYGARTPEDILYKSELERWRGHFDIDVGITVDRATTRWKGNVGVVTDLIKRAAFNPAKAAALVCGPEIMMRFAVQTLNAQGVTDDRIWVSMERNMKCAVGFCGHCQFGGNFVCKDGPVFRFDKIADIFPVREL